MRLFFLIASLFFFSPLLAHQTPVTTIVLDISPQKVAMELQLPLSELELAFGKNLADNSKTILQDYGSLLKDYVLAHTHAYVNKNKPWLVAIDEMEVDEGEQEMGGTSLKKLKVYLTLIPNAGENCRSFILDYDAIMHHVGSHIAYVAIRNDWELGKIQNNTEEAGIIRIDTKDNVVYPLNIDLQKGSTLKGFNGMFNFGMQHIKEGTDHLLFILTLLLPACLLVSNKKWAGYGGLKYSISRLLKIVTAFTIGHSVTLLIGVLGVVKIPAQLIEILIAVSILVTAIHAIKPLFYKKEMFIALGFGLIHGLAFSQSLQNLRLGTTDLLLSVAGFNLGIEAMQLLIVILIVPSFIIMSQTIYFKYIRNSLAVLVAIAAIGWILQRTTGNNNFINIATDKILLFPNWVIVGLYMLSFILFLVTYYKKSSKKLETLTNISSTIT